jgi:hypothetical protein
LEKNLSVIASGHDNELIIRSFGPRSGRPAVPQQATSSKNGETASTKPGESSSSVAALAETPSEKAKGKAKEEPLVDTQIIHSPPPPPQAPSSSSLGSGGVVEEKASSSTPQANNTGGGESSSGIKSEDEDDPPQRPRPHRRANNLSRNISKPKVKSSKC